MTQSNNTTQHNTTQHNTTQHNTTQHNTTQHIAYLPLGEICEIKTGKLNANASVESGKYPFFTTAKEISYINEYAFDGESLLVAGNANVGDCKYYNGKFNAYQRTYVLQKFKATKAKYLMYVIQNDLIQFLDNKKKQAAMTYIVLKDLQEFKIKIPLKKL